MNIVLGTKWGKAIASKAISKALFKKTGIRAGIRINELKASDDENGGKLTLRAEVNITKEDLEKIINAM